MSENVFVESAIISSKGQITIPKSVRNALNVKSGETITFLIVDGEVKIVNSASYAMRLFQAEMLGKALDAGIKSDEEIVELIREMRAKK